MVAIRGDYSMPEPAEQLTEVTTGQGEWGRPRDHIRRVSCVLLAVFAHEVRSREDEPDGLGEYNCAKAVRVQA